MIIREIADRLIRSVSGGTNPVDNKYEPEYVEALVPQIWANAIRIDYNGDGRRGGNRRLNYAWSLDFQPTYDATIQVTGVEYLLFACPKPMLISRFLDGLVYVGQNLQAKTWTKFTSREDIANAYARNFFKNGKDIGYFHNGTYLEVYGNKNLRSMDIRIIPDNPADVPTFNLETSEYPCDEALMSLMTDLFKADQNININKPADSVFDTSDTNQKAITTNNLRQQ